MWRDDNDKINDVFVKFESTKSFPAECPICKRNTAHLYMDIHSPRTRRGGLWVWCDACHAFSHSSIYVPDYWINCAMVDAEKLSSIPVYLNHISNVVDAHANTILKTVASSNVLASDK